MRCLGASASVILLLAWAGTAQAASKLDHEMCELGEPESCTRIVKDRRESAKARADAYVNRGNSYFGQDDDRALADYNQALQLVPSHAAAYERRGGVYHVKGDYDRAVADYSEAIRIDPKNSDYYTSRALTYKFKGDYDRAIADYSQAIRIDPKHDNGYMDRGRTYFQMGDYESAISDFSEAIRLPSKDSILKANVNTSFNYQERGRVLRNKGDYDRALADFTKAVDLDPQNVFGAWELGLTRYLRGDFKEAAASLQRALDLDNGDNSMLLETGDHVMLFRYLARARAGERAAAELEANARRLQRGEWPYPIVELYLGHRAPAATLDAAGKPHERCEAHFHIGVWHTLRGEQSEAEKALTAARDTCSKDSVELGAAAAELARLRTAAATPAPAPPQTASPTAATKPAAPANEAVELEFWRSVKDSGSPDMFQAYLDKFPEGGFAPLARIKLKELSEKSRP